MKRWHWVIYGTFLTMINFSSLRDIIDPNSELRAYYTILIAFNKTYLLFFLFNILSLCINTIIPLVIFLYAFNIQKWLTFWKILIFVRILFDLIGHHYDLQIFKSAYFQNHSYFLACLGVFILPLIPSYYIHYLYIQKTEKT